MLFAVYVLLVVAWFGRAGISLDKEVVVGVVLGALVVWSVGRPWRDAALLAVGWVPFLAALMCYDAARAGAAALGRPVVVNPQVHVDRLLGDQVPTVWLQHHLYDGAHVHWWDVLATVVYVSHFFACFALAGWLWTRDRKAWGIFATRFFILCFAAAVTFALVPTAPPWAAAELGRIEPVVRSATHGWKALHLREPEALLQQGRQIANPYAAIPSLHAGWALLFSVTLWPRATRAGRALLAGYALAMAFTLVYTGEHFVIDICVGWFYVAGAIWLERRVRLPLTRLFNASTRRGFRRREAYSQAVP